MSAAVFTVRRRDLAWGVTLVFLLSAVWVARSDVADAGATPPGAGIAVVYVAVGTNFPDALGVGPGAGLNGAPIILVPTNPPLDPAIVAELVRLDPRTVIIVGGLAVVSQATEDAIAALLPNAAVSRIAGSNRYKTNAAFSAATYPIEGWASIPAAAFTADTPATDAVVVGTFAQNSDGGTLFAPIQLPHGAEILEFKADVYDEDNGAGIVVYLYQIDPEGVFTEAASVSTTVPFATGFTTVSNTTIAAGTEIVDNENYAYFVYVTGADGNPVMVDVKVRYRLGVSTG